MSQKKSLKEVRKGDILYMGIPYEENTKDYYNGYRPQEIRGGLYTDKDGRAAKARYVVVIGRGDNDIIYLPLTSELSISERIMTI